MQHMLKQYIFKCNQENKHQDHSNRHVTLVPSCHGQWTICPTIAQKLSVVTATEWFIDSRHLSPHTEAIGRKLQHHCSQTLATPPTNFGERCPSRNVTLCIIFTILCSTPGCCDKKLNTIPKLSHHS